ncbi:MAG: FAD-dependent oxidoreductase [Patescibacteria group bacterium]
MAHSTHSEIIGIIGAGAAGLTAAETLKNKGYTNVTVLEQADQAGGKCCSITYEGRSYELGAGVIASSDYTVMDMVRKYQVPIERADFGKSLVISGATGQPIEEGDSFTTRLLHGRQLFSTYRKLRSKYTHIDEPGWLKVDPDLCVPFSEWVKKNNLPLVAKTFATTFTGFGYGYYADIPAAYVVKYYAWSMIIAFAKRQIYKFPNGIQSLWKTVAQHQQVVYNTKITNLKRGSSIQVETNHGAYKFDKLIITTPLDEALQWLDASHEETELFSKIQHCDYRVYAVLLNNFPKKCGFLPDNFTAARAGHPVFWYQRYNDSNLYTFYTLGDWKISDEEVLKNIETVVQQLGGKIERVHTKRSWKYFPHVNSEAMQAGYFDKLDKLQGESNTYYVGELLNFSSVGFTSAYAANLVERFF